MANEEHLGIIKQGTEVWNHWREENPTTHPDLSGADLFAANLIWANLGGANLYGANLINVNFLEANLSTANLVFANFSGANLSRANLSGANLTEANFSYTILEEANLEGTNLTEAKFLETLLHLTNLDGAKVEDTSLANIDLNQLSGLGSIVHGGPSSIGVDTLSLTLRGSGGRFTEEQLVFFEMAGVPHALLEYLPDLLETNPLQFYACFISYSTRDEEFAEPLNQDLNKAGIKTWKWDRDAVRGRDLAQSIGQAIRAHDKTILVCSVNSLTSPQVEREIQQALDKEVQIKTANAERVKEALAKGEKPPTVDADVLIPIRLDNTIFGWDSHLKGEVTRRMVADFTDAPPGSDKYNRELQFLIRALNPQSWPPTASTR